MKKRKATKPVNNNNKKQGEEYISVNSNSSSARSSLEDDSSSLLPQPQLIKQRSVNFTPTVASNNSIQSLLDPSDINDVDEDNNLIRKLTFTTKDCQTPGRYEARHKSTGEPLQVFLRIKPLLTEETQDNNMNTNSSESCIELDEDNIILTAPKDSAAYRNGETSAKFSFTKVFPAATTQEEIFSAAAAPLVDSFYRGHNGLMFAYGITNSGKTYTMQGTDAQPGIIPRVICSLFKKLAENEDSQLFPKYSMNVSYLEIYNDRIFDLLALKTNQITGIQQRVECKLQQGKSGDEVYVQGLKEINISTHKDALAILHQGQLNRRVCETALNNDSSRSHSVFTIKLLTGDDAVWSRLSVVDLAGSERINRVGDKNIKESVGINQSLLVLGRCLEALRWNQLNKLKQRVVPFRESKITRLFRDPLLGWGTTVMMCNASQDTNDYDETIHALKYASIAKEIKIMPRVDTNNSMNALNNRNYHRSSIIQPHHKRLAERPLQSLDEEFNNAEESGPALAPSRHLEADTYLDEIFQLKHALVLSEHKCASLDTAIRNELFSEMERQHEEMERLIQEEVHHERKQLTQQFERKLLALQEELQAKYNSSPAAAHSNLVLVDNLKLQMEKLTQENKALQASLKQRTEEYHSNHQAQQQTIAELELGYEAKLAQRSQLSSAELNELIADKAELQASLNQYRNDLEEAEIKFQSLEKLQHQVAPQLSFNEFIAEIRKLFNNANHHSGNKLSNEQMCYNTADLSREEEDLDLNYIQLQLERAEDNNVHRSNQPASHQSNISLTAEPMKQKQPGKEAECNYSRTAPAAHMHELQFAKLQHSATAAATTATQHNLFSPFKFIKNAFFSNKTAQPTMETGNNAVFAQAKYGGSKEKHEKELRGDKENMSSGANLYDPYDFDQQVSQQTQLRDKKKAKAGNKKGIKTSAAPAVEEAPKEAVLTACVPAAAEIPVARRTRQRK
jgi:kinesin family protein 20